MPTAVSVAVLVLVFGALLIFAGALWDHTGGALSCTSEATAAGVASARFGSGHDAEPGRRLVPAPELVVQGGLGRRKATRGAVRTAGLNPRCLRSGLRPGARMTGARSGPWAEPAERRRGASGDGRAGKRSHAAHCSAVRYVSTCREGFWTPLRGPRG